MPELPEVETIVKGLRENILGKKVQKAEIRYGNIFRDCSGKIFSEDNLKKAIKNIEGQRIIAVRRRGKYIIFELDDFSLIVHLRMTGKFSSEPAILKDKHTHVIFFFGEDDFLAYNDVRKFGTIQVIACEEEFEKTTASRLGPEPLGDEFTLEYLLQELKQTKKNIKAFLLTQEKIAGIGNIYADEILFYAGVNPLRPGNTISAEEGEKLYHGIKEKLLLGIEAGGASIRNYVNEKGEKGKFQDLIQVYGRKGCCCPKCGAEFITKTVAGRTSTFCPQCQK